MNIGQLIENPHQDLSAYTADLEKLIQKNSYSSTIMMLYLKALKDSKSIDFEENLKKTAILCQDRTVLFDFIQNETQKGAPIVDKIEQVVEEQPEDSTIEKPEILDELSEVKTENIEITSATEEQVEKEEKATEKVAPEEKTIPEQEDEEEKDETIFELNKDIYARAVHASIHNEEEDEDDEEENVSETTSTEKEEQLIVQEPTITPSEEEKTSQKEDKTHSDEKLSFLDWLKAQQSQGKPESTDHKVETKKHEKAPEKDAENKESIDVRDDAHRSNINAIVEKFIKEEPTITRRKAEFFSPSETAKKSIEDNDTIVTETLAEIYVNQGNYKKAIAAYEQLILKYPKKKSFFADRINFIKNLK